MGFLQLKALEIRPPHRVQHGVQVETQLTEPRLQGDLPQRHDADHDGIRGSFDQAPSAPTQPPIRREEPKQGMRIQQQLHGSRSASAAAIMLDHRRRSPERTRSGLSGTINLGAWRLLLDGHEASDRLAMRDHDQGFAVTHAAEVVSEMLAQFAHVN